MRLALRIAFVTGLLPWPSILHASVPRRPEIIVGILATSGQEDCQLRWEPTAEYLSQAIPEARFVIRPLTYEQVLPVVERGEIDFLITNPALYAACEHTYHATRIATLVAHCQREPAKTYAGVVICRADRVDIQSLADLRGKTLMAVHPWSFGGWLMAQRELRDLGIRAERDLRSVWFAGQQDAVVDAVMGGRVDAGTLTACDLIRTIQAGKVKPGDLRILPCDSRRSSIADCSTRAYPQWAFSKLRHTNDELAERVAETLLQMPPTSEAARSAEIAGWTIPLAYEPVHECLRELQIGPYVGYGKVTLAAAIRAYWPWLAAALLLIVIGWTTTGTILLLNRRLRESEAMRREAERFAASGRLAASVAHEINNPMGGIVNCLHLVKAMLTDDHPTRRYLAAAEKEANRVTHIVRQLLALHRCRPEKTSRFNLTQTIEEVVLMLQPAAQKQSVRIEHRVDTAAEWIYLPEESLRQVLFGLVTNAIEASPPGTVVHINACPGSSHLEILISDSGMGIAPDLRCRIFEPLFSTKTESGTGLGLGLSITRQIVESLQGTISLDSRVGKGTKFLIRLPMVSEPCRSGCCRNEMQVPPPPGDPTTLGIGRRKQAGSPVRPVFHRFHLFLPRASSRIRPAARGNRRRACRRRHPRSPIGQEDHGESRLYPDRRR